LSFSCCENHAKVTENHNENEFVIVLRVWDFDDAAPHIAAAVSDELRIVSEEAAAAASVRQHSCRRGGCRQQDLYCCAGGGE